MQADVVPGRTNDARGRVNGAEQHQLLPGLRAIVGSVQSRARGRKELLSRRIELRGGRADPGIEREAFGIGEVDAVGAVLPVIGVAGIRRQAVVDDAPD